MKKLKSLFLTVISSLLLLVSCIKTNDKTSIDEVNYNYQPKSVFTLVAGDDYRGILLSFTLKDFCGAGGGGSAAIGAAVGTAIGTAAISSFGLSNGGSKTTPSNLSLDGVVEKHPDLKKKMKDNGVTTDEAKEIITTFLDIDTVDDLYRNDKKILCIGRDLYNYKGNKSIKTYNELAIEGGYSRFYVDNYPQAQTHFGGDGPIECANLLLVYYCCDNDWNFICATHPYMYIYSNGYLPQKGYSYLMELETIRKSGYNYVGGYTWNTLPPPTWTGSDAWWEPTSFYVTR